MIHTDNLDGIFSDCLTIFLSFILNCQMQNFSENQNLFQILLIKVNRDMFFFLFNKIYFHNPLKTIFHLKIFRGYDFGTL